MLRMPHPSIEAARQFRESWQRENQQAQPPVETTPPPVTPEPVQTDAQQPVVVPGASLGTVQAPPAAPTPPSVPVPESYLAPPQAEQPEYRQLAEERDELRKQLEEARQLVQTMQAEAAQHQAKAADRFIDDYLDREGDAFVSIDREDARRLLKPMYQAFREEFGKRAQQTEETVRGFTESVQQRLDGMQQREEAEHMARAREAVMRAHPDLAELQNTDAYRRVMLTPVGGNANVLLGNVVASEFQKGNAEYVNQVLDQIRAEAGRDAPRPLADIASVSGSGTVTAPALPDNDNSTMDLSQLEQLKADFQTGKVSRKEFREAMRRYRGSPATQKP